LWFAESRVSGFLHDLDPARQEGEAGKELEAVEDLTCRRIGQKS
jgi:hypothetical protein